MKKLLFIILLLTTSVSLAQTKVAAKSQIKEKNITSLEEVDIFPEFPGGNHTLKQFLFANIQYPEKALQERIQGDIWVVFVIDSTGAINDMSVQEGINTECDAEVLRVLSLMPKWKPARKDQKNVTVWYGFSITFTLPKEKLSTKIDTTTHSIIPSYIGENEEIPFVVVQKMPQFRGGTSKMYKFISTNLRYPAEALEKKIEGNVFITFVVKKDGSIKDISISKSLGYGCDEEAIRLIKSMPKWRPGRQSGKNVPVRYSLPIRFTLPAK